MEKKDLKWESWYAWYPVILEDDQGIAWFEEVEQAFDEEFYKDQLLMTSCSPGAYPPIPLGRYFYRRPIDK